MGASGITDISIRTGEASFLEKMEEKHGTPPSSCRSRFTGVFNELDRYFSGKPVALDLPVDLSGSPFQLEVWKVLRTIPYGVTRSYGWAARQAGKGLGARAVGGACGANPAPIIVPCHRVLRADGPALYRRTRYGPF